MQTVYRTNDGKVFDSYVQAQEWEKENCPTKYYRVIVYVEMPAAVIVSASNRDEAIEKAKEEWCYEDFIDEHNVRGAEIDEEWEE